jgi:hypothetical protein
VLWPQACNGDHHTISYGCRALYVLDKHQQTFKVKEKNESESEAGAADGAQAGREAVATNTTNTGAEDEMSPEERQFFEKGRVRMEAYADELIPVLIDIIRKCVSLPLIPCMACRGVLVLLTGWARFHRSKPSAVSYPSDEAYMLRHICLLFFLFSSIPSILHKIVTSSEYQVSSLSSSHCPPQLTGVSRVRIRDRQTTV